MLRPRCTTEPLPTDVDELEKMEMVKTRKYQKILGIDGIIG